MYIYIYVCLSIYLSISLSISPSLSIYIYICMYVCVYISISMYRLNHICVKRSPRLKTVCLAFPMWPSTVLNSGSFGLRPGLHLAYS